MIDEGGGKYRLGIIDHGFALGNSPGGAPWGRTVAAFLGKSTVNIAFPRQSGANSLHWGLMSGTSGEVLVTADGVVTCGDATCGTAGAMRSNVPLAVRVRAGAAGQRGGNVVYTSFHNVAQSGPDVAQVLKYLVLNL